MIKYFCDGCNVEAPSNLNLREVRFQISPRIEDNPKYKEYELCDVCIKYIEREIIHSNKSRNK